MLVNVSGENGAGIVAFDSANGKVLWKATDEEASYSSPVAATIGGKRLACFFNRAGLVALDPVSGKIAWEFPWRPPVNASVNAAAPLVIGDLIFVSTCYDRGAALVRATDTGPKTVWSGDDILSNHYATSVHHQGFLYGIDGRADPGFSPAPSLRCVELRTGKVRWSQGDLIGVVVLAGEQLLVLTDRGELLLARATPDGFKPSARAQILGTTVRAQPALANGFLYARDKSRLVCVDLRRSP